MQVAHLREQSPQIGVQAPGKQLSAAVPLHDELLQYGTKAANVISSHTVRAMLGPGLLDPVLQEKLHLYSCSTCTRRPSSQDHKTGMV